MNPRKILPFATIATLLAAAQLTSGCGAFVLANKHEYQASVENLRAEMMAAANAARAASDAHDRAGYDRAVGRVLNACGDAERLVSYGEQAVRSYYSQQSTNAVMVQIAREAYEHNCKVDGQDRLREEAVALDDSARLLREACGCPRSDGYMTFGTCNFSEAAWDDYFAGDTTPYVLISGGVSGGLTWGVAPLFIGAGILQGLAENTKKKRDYCSAVHGMYTRQFRNVAALREQCGSPPPANVPIGALDGTTLQAYIDGALEFGRNGVGGSLDGSNIYGDAWEALEECELLTASLAQSPVESLASEIDAHVDQEVGTGDYEVPEYTPPPELPPPPPGGG